MIGVVISAVLARPKLLAAIGVVLVVITILGGVYLAGRNSVRDDIRNEIDRSREAGQDAFNDAEVCTYAGREWDQSAGVCR